MDIQLKNQLGQTATYETWTGLNSWGDSSYSTQKTVSARIIGRNMFVINGSAQQVLSEKQLISETEIGLRSLVWLPGESTGDPGWVVLASAQRVDENGSTDYWKSFLGRRVGRGSD